MRQLCIWMLTLCAGSILVSAQTNAPGPITRTVSVVGSLQHPALVESSGLVASSNYPEVFWTHNDGGEPFIFAINRQGEHLGAFEVQGANLIDWEAITRDDFGNLYLADTGTNGLARTHSAIHRVEEPDPSDEWGPAKVEQTWFIRFPGEREDCESFFVLNGYGYLVTKYPRAGAVSLYRFLLGSSTEYTLEFVARVDIDSPVSDAALSEDRQRLAFVTEEAVEVFFINGDPANVTTSARRDTEYENDVMEGVTFVPDGLLVTSDSIRDVLLFSSDQLTGAPIIIRPLSNKSAFLGSNVFFRVFASGVPDVSFAWFFNGALLPGETNSTLIITNVTLADAGLYEVVVSNAAGTARSSARLTVLERTTDLRITEVMSSEALGAVPKADWWELTSFDDQPVDIGGWRFNDSSGGLADGFVIPSGVTIRPGESIIFVENLTRGEFLAWWGTNNFAPRTQIITYSGTQLSFSATGDTLRLWTNEATDDSAVYAQVSFGPAEVGVSFGYDPVTGVFGEKSRVGVNGAFVAAAGTDIGSPGRIRNVPPVEGVDLRITEVMSSETVGTVPKADWWELTSFETAPVDLTGWRFNDSTGGLNDAFVIPAGVTIQPGESIIFVENLTPAEFLTWWGTNNISPVTQIIPYSGIQLSFSAAGDTLRLWTDEAADDSAILAQVSFGPADAGVSFGYDPVTGIFGEKSQPGVNGAFVAAAGGDIGSPGRIRNPPVDTIDLRITEVMSSEATGTVPTSDWWELTSFDTAPVDLSGWRFNDGTGGLIDAFVIPSGVIIQPGESIIFVENLTPDEFFAWWGTNNFAPGIRVIAYTGPELSFSAAGDSVRLWTSEAADDTDLFAQVTFGAADPGVSFGFDPLTGVFGERSRVGINGALVAAAGPDVGSPGRIRGTSEPVLDLRITEVMSSPAVGTSPTADWWELTSFETEPVDLGGWSFNDSTGGLIDAFVIPNVTIQPGESVIFVEDLTPDEFRTWWGETNIPSGTQIITYSGTELSFSATADSVRLWTNGVANDSELYTQVIFGAADPGVSFGYDPESQVFGEKSVPGVHGAFVAATGPDVGSPGRIRNAAEIRLLSRLSDRGVQLEIAVEDEHEYTLEVCDDLSAGRWTPTGEIFRGDNANAVLLQKALEGRRFYRARRN